MSEDKNIPKDCSEAFEEPAGRPQAFIQWKSTDVCMDVYCGCGCHSHVDDYFAYHVQCPACGKTYAVSPYPQLVEVSAPEYCIIRGDIT